MTLIYHHETPDDGYFKLFKTQLDIAYSDMYNDIFTFLYDCDGFSVNKRYTGIFTVNNSKVGAPMCPNWNYTPERYIFQPFTPMLYKLLEKAKNIYQKHKFTDAIVNLYNEGDFIAHHKDYHSDNHIPCSLVCSFEEEENQQHIMEFYRTIGDQWSTRKDKSETREEFTIPLPHQSFGLMVGMQRHYVHAIKPGKKRISVVFR